MTYLPTIAAISYAPGPVPQKPQDIPAWLAQELQRIAAAINQLSLGHVDVTNVAPAKPRDGDIRLADGTNWNPGSGAGFYGYRGGSWRLLG